MTWADGPMLALDFESSGIDAHTVRAVQVAIARIRPGQGAESMTWIIDPGIEVPEQASAIHGITTARCRAEGEQPRLVLERVADAIVDWFGKGLPLVAFNASYDCTLLEAELARHGLPSITETMGDFAPVIDPYVLDKHISRRRGPRKLVNQCEHYNVRIDGAHDAGHDALAAARVAWRIGQTSPQLAAMSLRDLHEAQIGWAREQADSLRAYFDSKNIEHDGVDGTWPVRTAPAGAAVAVVAS